MTDSSKKNITQEIFKLEPDAIIEMFEIDFSHLKNDFSFLSKTHKISLGGGSVEGQEGDHLYRFCSSKNSQKAIIWQGKPYQPLPIHTSEFEIPSDGRLPRPKLTIGNPSGLLSSIVAMNYDFQGCKVTRKRTFVRFLDDANFNSGNPSGAPDENAHLPDEIFYINKKTAETKTSLQFELASILEMEGVKFPARQMLANHCSFRYRGEGCGYKGGPCETESAKYFSQYGVEIFTHPGNDSPIQFYNTGHITSVPFVKWKSEFEVGYKKGDVVNLPGGKPPEIPVIFVCIKSHVSPSPNPYVSKEFWIADSCQRTLPSCLKRFGSSLINGGSQGIPFGGFPETDGFSHA
jgi:lambda family phage minor tail protein L